MVASSQPLLPEAPPLGNGCPTLSGNIFFKRIPNCWSSVLSSCEGEGNGAFRELYSPWGHKESYMRDRLSLTLPHRQLPLLELLTVLASSRS